MPKLRRASPAYHDARRMLLCFHEAGHAVVGHALGWELLRLTIEGERGQVHFDPVTIQVPYLIEDVAERAECVAARRGAMAVVAAGHVAATIHQREVEERGYASRPARRAYGTYWEYLVSDQYQVEGMGDDDPGSDYSCLVRDANSIQWADALAPIPNGKSATKKRGGKVLAELLAAEGRAEAVVRRHWDAVSAIATASRKSATGRLTRDPS